MTVSITITAYSNDDLKGMETHEKRESAELAASGFGRNIPEKWSEIQKRDTFTNSLPECIFCLSRNRIFRTTRVY